MFDRSTTASGWICSQIGAREHYAIPRALHRRQHLRRLYTEGWSGPIMARLGRQLPFLGRLAGRFHRELQAAEVVAFNARFTWDLLVRRRPPDREQEYCEYLRLGSLFARLVARDLMRRPGRLRAEAFFGYNTGCLEVLPLLRDHGVLTVVDQIDPGQVEEELVQRECEKWPGWQRLPGRVPDIYYERLAAEWRQADRVVVNSAWSRQALVAQGVPAGKIAVVPLAYEPAVSGEPRRPLRSRCEPLRVLWLGSVLLRKGIQYLVQAARLLADRPIRFRVVGPMDISRQARESAPSNMTFVGPVSRDGVSACYHEADLFVLPTLSDGFAITQLEAMAHGLPVIATPSCGEVVTDGVDGRIVPAANPEALAGAIAAFDDDRDLLGEMSLRAPITARQFSLTRVAKRLEDLAAAAHAGRGQSPATRPVVPR